MLHCNSITEIHVIQCIVIMKNRHMKTGDKLINGKNISEEKRITTELVTLCSTASPQERQMDAH